MENISLFFSHAFSLPAENIFSSFYKLNIDSKSSYLLSPVALLTSERLKCLYALFLVIKEKYEKMYCLIKMNKNVFIRDHFPFRLVTWVICNVCFQNKPHENNNIKQKAVYINVICNKITSH